jgi:hypothetical protein
MTMNPEYPWQKLPAASILEFNPPLLCEKLKCAEEAINNRIQQLAIGRE